MTSPKATIPTAVCAVVGGNLSEVYSHAELDNLFWEAGAPGEPPTGPRVQKCTAWLRRCSEDLNTDAPQVLGRVLERLMAAWRNNLLDEDYDKRKSDIEKELEKHGFRYDQGRVVEGASSPVVKDLKSIIRSRDIPSLRVEIDRAVASVETDPAAAITAACAIFEAFCIDYIENEGIECPKKLGALALWKVVRSRMKLSPATGMDSSLKQILGGLASVVNGVSSLRNRSGSAHGRGSREYRVEAHDAKLAINAAATLVVYLFDVGITGANTDGVA